MLYYSYLSKNFFKKTRQTNVLGVVNLPSIVSGRSFAIYNWSAMAWASQSYFDQTKKRSANERSETQCNVFGVRFAGAGSPRFIPTTLRLAMHRALPRRQLVVRCRATNVAELGKIQKLAHRSFLQISASEILSRSHLSKSHKWSLWHQTEVFLPRFFTQMWIDMWLNWIKQRI